MEMRLRGSSEDWDRGLRTCVGVLDGVGVHPNAFYHSLPSPWRRSHSEPWLAKARLRLLRAAAEGGGYAMLRRGEEGTKGESEAYKRDI